jgi:hypothetical protein
VKFFISGRQAGKTSSVVEAMRWENNAVMIVHNMKEATRIVETYPWMQGKVATVSRAATGLLSNRYQKVYIDNLDLVLPALLGGINAEINVTATGETV